MLELVIFTVFQRNIVLHVLRKFKKNVTNFELKTELWKTLFSNRNFAPNRSSKEMTDDFFEIQKHTDHRYLFENLFSIRDRQRATGAAAGNGSGARDPK